MGRKRSVAVGRERSVTVGRNRSVTVDHCVTVDRRSQSISSTGSLLYFVMALCGYGAAAFVPSLTLDRPLFYREVCDRHLTAT